MLAVGLLFWFMFLAVFSVNIISLSMIYLRKTAGRVGLQFAVFFHIFQGFIAFFYQPDFRYSVFFEKSVYLII